MAVGEVGSRLVGGGRDHNPRLAGAGQVQHLPVLPVHGVLRQGGGEAGEGVVAHYLVLGEGGGDQEAHQDQSHQSHPQHFH